MAPTLSNGFSMPLAPCCDFSMEITLNTTVGLGLGLFRMEGKDLKDLLFHAIKVGYRHFDCATKYKKEVEVGEALAEAFHSRLVRREEIFIATKLGNSDHGHVIEACKDSLKKLQLDYLDLYLVHFPVATKHAGIGACTSVLDENGVLDRDNTITLEATRRGMEDLVPWA